MMEEMLHKCRCFTFDLYSIFRLEHYDVFILYLNSEISKCDCVSDELNANRIFVTV